MYLATFTFAKMIRGCSLTEFFPYQTAAEIYYFHTILQSHCCCELNVIIYLMPFQIPLNMNVFEMIHNIILSSFIRQKIVRPLLMKFLLPKFQP